MLKLPGLPPNVAAQIKPETTLEELKALFDLQKNIERHLGPIPTEAETETPSATASKPPDPSSPTSTAPQTVTPQPAIPVYPAPDLLPAIERCLQAYNRAYNLPARHPYERESAGNKAYRRALPPLRGHDNIADFIACIAHAILIDTIATQDCTRLLYAAQVAQSTLRGAPQRSHHKPKSVNDLKAEKA